MTIDPVKMEPEGVVQHPAAWRLHPELEAGAAIQIKSA